jgi:hypothetical protein
MVFLVNPVGLKRMMVLLVFLEGELIKNEYKNYLYFNVWL